jgi:hypothetical protein
MCRKPGTITFTLHKYWATSAVGRLADHDARQIFLVA